MIYFNSDYLEGAHPAIMERLLQTNMEQTVGYGEDEYCAAAREKIKAACRAPEADVHFLVGGTLTNTTVIASVLRPYQGVLTAASGHINCHETGAIESSGHKVLALPSSDGKITAQQVEDYYNWHHFNPDYEHMVMPGMVYISFPTEGGTLYSKAELTALYEVCKKCGLPLFIDGARLGYGLTCDGCDLTLPALLVLLFDTLFTDDLYFKISRHANVMAKKIHAIFEDCGYKFLFDSPTNQQYPIMSDAELAILGQNFGYEYWERIDEPHSAIRFASSWATTEEYVAAPFTHRIRLGRRPTWGR